MKTATISPSDTADSSASVDEAPVTSPFDNLQDSGISIDDLTGGIDDSYTVDQ